VRGRAVGHWPTIRMHKAVGANGGGEIVHERVAKQYSVLFGQFGGNSASSSPTLTGPLELSSGEFVIVHDTTAVEVARRHRIFIVGRKDVKRRFFPESTSQPFGS
jgi:hypothetical protein